VVLVLVALIAGVATFGLTAHDKSGSLTPFVLVIEAVLLIALLTFILKNWSEASRG
jgi:hypothetical protein